MSTDYNPTAKERYWAAVVAQGAGILLLLFIGNVFPVTQGDLSDGLEWIHLMGFVAFAALSTGLILSILLKRWCTDFNTCVDTAIMTFLCFDIPIVLFLVCQQGGLSRSMFVPLFFLIPAAHLAVERPEKRFRVYVGVAFIAICLVVSFLISRRMPHVPTSADLNFQLFGLFQVSITDFSMLNPKRFSLAILIVSLLALLIPFLQWGILQVIADDKKPVTQPAGNLTPENQS